MDLVLELMYVAFRSLLFWRSLDDLRDQKLDEYRREAVMLGGRLMVGGACLLVIIMTIVKYSASRPH